MKVVTLSKTALFSITMTSSSKFTSGSVGFANRSKRRLRKPLLLSKCITSKMLPIHPPVVMTNALTMRITMMWPLFGKARDKD